MSQRPEIHYISGDVQTSGTTSDVVASFRTASNQSYAISAEVTGINRAGNEAAAYFLRGCFKNIGGTVSLVGSTDVVFMEDDSDWNASFSISLGDVDVDVVGGTGDTVDWTCALRVIVSQG